MKRLTVSLLLFIALTCLMLGNAIAASDKENPVIAHKFGIYLGGFFPQVSSKTRLDGDILGPGDNVSLENSLGLEDSKTVLWGGARWKISRRNMVEFEFANLNRDGSVEAISDPIQIGDMIVQAGAKIDTGFDVTLGRLTYGFTIFQDDKKEINLKAGVHIADLGATFQATGAVCVDGEIPPNCSVFVATPRLESESITAPLPHLGASFAYAFSPTLAARFQVIGFAIELDNIDGSMLEVDADLVWNPWRHFGLGAGFRYFNINIESEGSDLNGEFDFEYYGPAIYGIYTF
jgi:hypothetical protein